MQDYLCYHFASIALTVPASANALILAKSVTAAFLARAIPAIASVMSQHDAQAEKNDKDWPNNVPLDSHEKPQTIEEKQKADKN